MPLDMLSTAGKSLKVVLVKNENPVWAIVTLTAQNGVQLHHCFFHWHSNFPLKATHHPIEKQVMIPHTSPTVRRFRQEVRCGHPVFGGSGAATLFRLLRQQHRFHFRNSLL